MPNYPIYPQNYPQYPMYPQYQQPTPPIQPQMTAAAQPMQQTQPAPLQIQNGGFISVRSIEEARNWPIAPGNSVTFKDENAPYVYTKTMGFSQLDRPTFDVFRLVKEEDAFQSTQNAPASAAPSPGAPMPEYALKRDVEALKEELEDFRNRLSGLTARKPATKKKEEDGSDE